MLFEIILAANYLDIKPLLYVFPFSKAHRWCGWGGAGGGGDMCAILTMSGGDAAPLDARLWRT